MRCEGRPGVPCPFDKKEPDIHFGQGDMWLCKECEDIRFPRGTMHDAMSSGSSSALVCAPATNTTTTATSVHSHVAAEHMMAKSVPARRTHRRSLRLQGVAGPDLPDLPELSHVIRGREAQGQTMQKTKHTQVDKPNRKKTISKMQGNSAKLVVNIPPLNEMNQVNNN